MKAKKTDAGIGNGMAGNLRTAIGLKMTTKDKLDKNRAPGQCYDGFICQLVDLWEKVKEERQDYILNTNKGEVMLVKARE